MNYQPIWEVCLCVCVGGGGRGQCSTERLSTGEVDN